MDGFVEASVDHQALSQGDQLEEVREDELLNYGTPLLELLGHLPDGVFDGGASLDLGHLQNVANFSWGPRDHVLVLGVVEQGVRNQGVSPLQTKGGPAHEHQIINAARHGPDSLVKLHKLVLVLAVDAHPLLLWGPPASGLESLAPDEGWRVPDGPRNVSSHAQHWTAGNNEPSFPSGAAASCKNWIPGVARWPKHIIGCVKRKQCLGHVRQREYHCPGVDKSSNLGVILSRGGVACQALIAHRRNEALSPNVVFNRNWDAVQDAQISLALHDFLVALAGLEESLLEIEVGEQIQPGADDRSSWGVGH